ncbi:MAG: DUF4159 domain-containing protein, partial [Alphaproteobacteria bacterium]|nr:DUF4159 domain-containing protein [Alphaproteobacteria bacterium]
PPRPQSIPFPPLRILKKLLQQEETPDKTPWWLLLLRLCLAAILIFAVAHPLLREGTSNAAKSGPLLLIVDDDWAAAKTWPAREEALQNILQEAGSNGRVVTLATTTPSQRVKNLASMAASDALNIARALQPQALKTDRASLLKQLQTEKPKADQVIWLTNGLNAASSEFTTGLSQLYGKGTLSVLDVPNAETLALAPPTIDGGDIRVTAFQGAATNTKAILQAKAGNGRILGEAQIDFAGKQSVSAKISMPVELRNEIQTLGILGQDHAGAKQLLDDRWRRKTIAIQTGAALEASQPLLSPLHYVTRALEPYGEISEPATSDDLKSALDAGLSLLVLADIGTMKQQAHDDVAAWVEKGGVLLRFAGPHLAASADDLLPVKLREGDRNLGSSLSWETPQSMQNISAKSPFAGIKIDPRVTISRQVLAEPDTELPDKTWVSLSDGTPLVTAAKKGKGLIVLFHVTANADWSNLPLSGTFVAFLQRIVTLAPAAGSNAAAITKSDQAQNYGLRLLMTGAGELMTPSASYQAIPVKDFDSAKASAATPVGLYSLGDQQRAINLDIQTADLTPITALPEGLAVQTLSKPKTTNLAEMLFAIAAIVFLLDTLAAILIGGGLRLRSRAALVPLLVVGLVWQLHPHEVRADDQTNMQAALQTHLAYVKTGDSNIDQMSEQGLKGLGLIMADRTSAALGAPMGVDPETDELVFYPVLYWPITEQAKEPSEKALTKLDLYMKNGGTIFFDTRDAGLDFGSSTGSSAALKRILSKLDIPPLEPVPPEHALTKSFYLLNEWPGRYEGGSLWVESQAGDAPAKSDGVSGIIIGSNDYAAAWALDDNGQPVAALVPGSERQREFAFRVGVNVVMYALTGNYKTDQVHVPALLQRLGQ